jgi:Copper transport outer membrane protein, MctB
VIDFRYHLVSIVAVFLALAIGIVLGSTELQGPAYNFLDKTTAKLQTELGQVSSQRDAAQAQASAGNAFAATVQPAVLKDLLPGQRVLIVTEPGAQSSVISGITSAATDAGASVTGQINLQPKFFDTTDTTQDTLNQTNLDIAQHTGITLDSTATYQQQAAQVIASEILVKSESSATGSSSPGSSSAGSSSPGGTTPAGSPSTSPSTGADQGTGASTMLTAYAASQFLSITGQPATPATLTVVVTPQNAPADGSSDPLDRVLVPLVQELAAKSSATVVVGSSAASGAGSPIAVLRENNIASQVSTVDDADLTIGQTAAIQALAVLLGGGRSGSYGFTANGASAVAPSPVPTPSPSASVTAPPSASKKAKT